jgi:hypothetical protein
LRCVVVTGACQSLPVLHPQLVDALTAYLDATDELAPGLVEGLYVVGSAALDDWHPGHSNVDIVAVTAEPATDDDALQIRAAHALLAETRPLPHVDGPYVAWGDLVVEPATGLHRPWVHGGVFHHDSECPEINPITWYVLSRHALCLRGPAPGRMEVATGVEARVRFCIDNLRTYWAPLAGQIARSLGERHYTTADLEWCVLGALRVHHTIFTGEVTSKRGAGLSAAPDAPTRFHDTIGEALAIRAAGSDGPVPDALMRSAVELISWIAADVAAAR